MSVVGVMDNTAPIHGADPGSTPRATLQDIRVSPIPMGQAKELIVRYHYLHSLPGGTQSAFGVFVTARLMGAMTIGCGPAQAYCLVDRANRDSCAVLSRMWLSEELPRNSESRVIGIAALGLRKNTNLKFLVSYADPSRGHIGTIYKASGWLYTGLSEAMARYDMGDGVARHSRSFSHAFGSHSLRYFARHGIDVKTVP